MFGAPMSVTHAWETVYPHEEFGRNIDRWKLATLAGVALRTNAVALGARQRANPYAPRKPEPVAVEPAGRVRILRRDDLTSVAAAAATMTTTAAESRVQELAASGVRGLQLVSAGAIL